MEDFTYEELRMIRLALETEIFRRQDNPLVNPERLAKFEDLYDKVNSLIQNTKSNN